MKKLSAAVAVALLAVPSWAQTVRFPSCTKTAIYAVSATVKQFGCPSDTVGLVSYWSLDEPSAAAGAVTRADSIGSNNLTDNNTVASAPYGPTGTVSAYLNANSEYLTVTTPTALQKAHDRSFAFWFYNTDIVNQRGIFSQENTVNDGSPTLILQHKDAAPYGLAVFHAGGYSSYFPLSIGWHHVVWTYVTSTTKQSLYIDSVAVISAATSADAGNDTNLHFGTGFPSYFTGNLAWAGAWSEAIDQTKVTSLYNNGNGKSYAQLSTADKVNLVSYWNLSEASGNRADSHGSLTLTDTNTVTSATSTQSSAHNTSAFFRAAASETLTNAAIQLADTDWTVAGWLYRDATGVDTLASCGNATSSLILRGDGATSNAIMYAVSATKSVTSTGTDGAGAWHFLVGYHDSVNNLIGISVDGGAFQTSATGGANSTPDSAFMLGGWVGHNFLSGRVDEVGVYSLVLTQAKVTALYNGGAGKFYTFQ